MPGMTIQSLKRHPQLVPLFVSIGAGVFGAGFYLLRLAVKSPDVCWDKKGNPEPHQKYDAKQYKFFNITQNYSTEANKRPEF